MRPHRCGVRRILKIQADHGAVVDSAAGTTGGREFAIEEDAGAVSIDLAIGYAVPTVMPFTVESGDPGMPGAAIEEADCGAYALRC